MSLPFGLGDWSKAASEVELVEGLDVLAHELRQRMGKANVPDPDELGQAPATEPPRLLTAKEVAAYTNLPIGRVYALAREGNIGGVVPFGERQYRFEPVALEAWVKDGGERAAAVGKRATE